MTSYLDMSCVRCHRGLRVRTEYQGRTVICNHCGQAFEVRAPRVDVETAPTTPTTTNSDDGPRESVRPAVEIQSTWEARLRDAERELEGRDSLIADLRSRLDAARVELDVLKATQSELEVLRAEAAARRSELDAVRSQAADAERFRLEVESLHEQVRRSEMERRSANERIGHLHTELETSKVLIGQLESERDEVRAALAERTRAADDEIGSLRSLREHDAAELASLRERLHALAGENERLVTIEEELARVHGERDELAQRLQEIQADAGRLRDSLDDLACRHAEEQSRRGAVEHELRTSQSAWTTREQEREREFAEERRIWESERSHLESELDRLRDHVTSLTRQIGERDAERIAWNERARHHEEEIREHLDRARQTADEAEGRHQAQMAELRLDLERAQGVIDRQKNQIVELAEKLCALEVEIERREQQAVADRNDREQQLAANRADWDAQRVALEAAATEAQRVANREARGLRDEIQRQQRETEILRLERDDSLRQLHEMVRERDRWQRRIEAVESGDRATHSTMRVEIERLRRSLNAALRERDEAHELADDLARQAAELQEQLDRLGPGIRPDGDSRDEMVIPAAGLLAEPPPSDEILDASETSVDGSTEPTSTALSPVIPALPPARVKRESHLHHEIHWYVEMNKKLSELNRKRKAR